MTTFKMCHRCNGSKKYMGNGMALVTCYLCDERGRIFDEVDEPSEVKTSGDAPLDRRSTSYKKAIKDIMMLNPTYSWDDAVKIFEREYSKK